MPPFALHEACSLFAGPCALGFVKYDNLLDGDIGIADVFIPKVVNILDKTAHPCVQLASGKYARA